MSRSLLRLTATAATLSVKRSAVPLLRSVRTPLFPRWSSAAAPVRRFLSTQATTSVSASDSTQQQQQQQHEQQQDSASSDPQDQAVSWWLFGSAALVFGMVVVGGITRLTESGLSITDWKPLVGIKPPLSEAEWLVEFDKYKQFPEYQRQNSDMTLDEFKRIFFWEWAHRAYGRVIGVAFAVPFAYFLARGRIPRREALKLGGIFALGGLQGAVGWWMVKSGLHNVKEGAVARVSHLRLATHLGSAFTIYTLLLWQAMRWRVRRSPVPVLPAAVRSLRMRAHVAAALVFTTAMSGALVAGLDAGLIYNNEFPLMGGSVFPSDGLTMSPAWRNFVYNDAAVQFDHRWLAMSTAAFISATYAAARRGGARSVYAALHPAGRLALNCVMLGVVGQVTLGITTLMMFVPVSLGAAHQAGSLTLLSFTLWLMREIKPRKIVRIIKPGLQLEQRVVRLFQRRGSFNVRRSVRVRDGNGNMSEIDVIAGIGPFKTYIECKNYSGHRVPLEDVAKFAAVLSLNGIPLSRGLFITTSTYVPRARTIGIKTVTGDELVELERTAWRVALLRYCAYAALLLVPVALVASEFTDMDEQALAAVRAHVLAQQHRVDAASVLIERLRRSAARAYDKTKKRLDELVGAWWR